ncbi:formate dehydrogenase accessory sulfurtransferase FdhD [Polaribacter sp. Hel1_85]|uniref:formate dehydrogenase accessory sulfurtransferase FdhD n=1 Tax=Polaribacter sp. Hel1_85 TaxID=1250005 RepID=UPI00052B7DC5|nr:formate dehydrogenase accessory sulfurtransferase FdhD [Polaribacter sp. Hel1_85]KGL63017.1 formate dehydrogenase subunit D [Polaribacter sp. Hel1_85]
MQTTTYQAIKIYNNSQNTIQDVLVVEAPLQININDEPYTVVMRTPDNDKELIRGLLFAEDIYKSEKTLIFQINKEDNGVPSIINVTISKELLGKGYLNKRTLLSVSSCGICGKKELKDIKVEGEKFTQINNFTVDNLHKMLLNMSSFQHTFKSSGGSHAAAIYNNKNEFLTLKEDIGRHNAVDKVIGDLIIKDYLHHANYLFVSGRVSYEIISKAFLAKIPVIVAISACSSLAIDFAKEFGICLIGFTRDHKMTIYSNPSLVKKETVYV